MTNIVRLAARSGAMEAVDAYHQAKTEFDRWAQALPEIPWPLVDAYNMAIRNLMQVRLDNPVVKAAQRECVTSNYVREQFLESANLTAAALVNFLIDSLEGVEKENPDQKAGAS
jgi:hypothetical protein